MQSSTQDEKLQALLVEDDALSLQSASTLLTKNGYILYTATTAQETLQKCQEKTFDIIYLDLGLPDENGLQVANAIRQDAKNRNNKTTIIALTAYLDAEVQMECIKAGIQYLLAKPLDHEKIETAEVIMNNYINGRKLDLFLKQQSSVTPPIIDLQSTLQNVGGNVELVKEMVEQFMKTLPETQRKIQAEFQAKKWDELQATVHKLNGAAAYCGVPRLRAAIHTFESALRQKSSEYLEIYQACIREIDLLRAEYQRKQAVLFDQLTNTLDTSESVAPFSGHLLLVEDEMINQIIIKELLETLGFTVNSAPNGLTAIALLTDPNAHYNAAVMDVGLPDISGIEVTRRLRSSNAPLKKLPIIALTGHVSPKYQADCLANGMNDFLSKPTTREQLSSTLKRILPHTYKGPGK